MRLHEPNFSVVLPTYNRKAMLQRAIDSVLEQTYRNFELLVIDDGSTDGTDAVMKSYADERLRYIRCQRNQGPSAARNRGITESRGTLISLLDSDDEYMPEFLERTAAAWKASAESTGFSWTGTIKHEKKRYGDVYEEVTTKRLWRPNYSSKSHAYEDCLRWDPRWGTGHGVTLRRDCLNAIGLFDETLKARQDIDLLLRLLCRYDYIVIPEFLVVRHRGDWDRVSSNYLARAQAYQAMLAKHRDPIRKDSQARAFFELHIAKQLARGGRRGSAIRHAARAVLAQPARSRSWKGLAECMFPILWRVRGR